MFSQKTSFFKISQFFKQSLGISSNIFGLLRNYEILMPELFFDPQIKHDNLCSYNCTFLNPQIWIWIFEFQVGQVMTGYSTICIRAEYRTQVRNICFFLLSFPQNERKIYSFCSVSFAQFVYFLREVCLLFNFEG